jgi:hypothetical protein
MIFIGHKKVLKFLQKPITSKEGIVVKTVAGIARMDLEKTRIPLENYHKSV